MENPKKILMEIVKDETGTTAAQGCQLIILWFKHELNAPNIKNKYQFQRQQQQHVSFQFNHIKIEIYFMRYKLKWQITSKMANLMKCDTHLARI